MRCLYCYKELNSTDPADYHTKCIKAFFGTNAAPELPYRLDEMEKLAKEIVESSVTIPGVQPKISLNWIKDVLKDNHKGRLTIMDALNGKYILKPQNPGYSQMPENEHLSMLLARLFKIEIVPVSLIRLASGELCFITQRIDRKLNGEKLHLIDFMQIMGLDDKYKGTMESLGAKIGELSVNTLLDKLRFFELAVFNFIIGNNDMHLKNFSMWKSEMGWILSPAYDLLNVNILTPDDKDETALLLGGKKTNLNKNYFDRLGSSLQLTEKQVQSVYKKLPLWLPGALELINCSFLSEENRVLYGNHIVKRTSVFLPEAMR